MPTPSMESATDRAIRALQMYAAGVLSRRSAIEAIGIVKDVDLEMARIAAEHQATGRA